MKDKVKFFYGFMTTALFVMLIGVGTITSILAKEKSFSDTENRYLATRPEFTLKTYFKGEFSKDYEEYVKDQFPMRTGLVAMKNYCDMALLKTEIKGVLVADDNYFIENHSKETYKKKQAEDNANALAQFGVRMSGLLGREHVSVMIVPTAQSVLDKKLPFGAHVYDQNEYIGYIAGLAGDYVDVFLDADSVLTEHADEYIYYRTDHHWTSLGAYYCYRYWAEQKGYKALSKEEFDVARGSSSFLGTVHNKLNIAMKPDVLELWRPAGEEYDVTINMSQKSDSFFDMSYLEKKDKYSVFFGGNPGLVEINSKNKSSDDTLLIIKDSYANCFTPMAAGSFDKVYMIDLRYFNMDIDTFVTQYNVTDVLVLYNADSAATDIHVRRLGNRK